MPTRTTALALMCTAILLGTVWTPTLAGEVYGKITMKGASVGDGASVAARCGKVSYAASPTDKAGRYHIVLGQSGKCSLTITYQGQAADLDMVSYDDEVQVDIDLDRQDGKLIARRR